MNHKIHEFYEIVSQISRMASSVIENLDHLFWEIGEDLNISDDEFAVIEKIYEALVTITTTDIDDLHTCSRGECTCGQSH